MKPFLTYPHPCLTSDEGVSDADTSPLSVLGLLRTPMFQAIHGFSHILYPPPPPNTPFHTLLLSVYHHPQNYVPAAPVWIVFYHTSAPEDSEPLFGRQSRVFRRLSVMCWFFAVIFYISDIICYNFPYEQSRVGCTDGVRATRVLRGLSEYRCCLRVPGLCAKYSRLRRVFTSLLSKWGICNRKPHISHPLIISNVC
ncbi:hypothetical protein EDC04DRAFT_448062 [Pisolithus marmoratus]|nr:hypothetical protein EDC04DRAFT_448062 [Pisolithus marmoratus]